MKHAAVTILLHLMFSLPASAQISGPILNLANSHTYYLLEESSWTDAKIHALTLGGLLTIINDAAEDEWVYATFGNYGGVSRRLWIGLNDSQLEGTFIWADGTPLSYANFADGQPDNAGRIEHFVHIDGSADIYPGRWNDLPNIKLGTYGVVEIASVPESSTQGFVAVSGLGVLILYRCSRTRRAKSFC